MYLEYRSESNRSVLIPIYPGLSMQIKMLDGMARSAAIGKKQYPTSSFGLETRVVECAGGVEMIKAYPDLIVEEIGRQAMPSRIIYDKTRPLAQIMDGNGLLVLPGDPPVLHTGSRAILSIHIEDYEEIEVASLKAPNKIEPKLWMSIAEQPARSVRFGPPMRIEARDIYSAEDRLLAMRKAGFTKIRRENAAQKLVQVDK